ncbi:polysaccharide biosynthesis/export family protein [Novosphingobium terrae]|uniref:polysaccharide biosynthesis/export family protein n=1 Tax=Novosphingobium terrae TaxID=2726189 RepID=UPI0019810132|nr:polysaccharide biosynthesis/export family protein [Novosphingobium terrae]
MTQIQEASDTGEGWSGRVTGRMILLGAVTAVLAAMSLTGCSGSFGHSPLAQGPGAYKVIPAPDDDGSVPEYRIGPLDSVDVTVFQEADISAKGIPVDAAGDIAMPLIGRVHAAGKTSVELADFVAHQLGERYYVNPQVTVSVASSVSQRVTVEGQVTEPGIYPIHGATTLLDAIALAKGETENAAYRQVAIIRIQNGKRTGAVFDISHIRRGEDKDPQLLPRDVIIVGHSTGKQVWHDLLRAAPLLNVFAQF